MPSKSPVTGERLFEVQQMYILQKPLKAPIDQVLADEDEPGLNDFERIMMENCDYEKRINQDMMQRQFNIKGFPSVDQ